MKLSFLRKFLLFNFISIFFSLFVAGCVSKPIHITNKNEIYKDCSLYKIGIIKVMGKVPLPINLDNDFNKKIKALKKIPKNEIFFLLENEYDIKISRHIEFEHIRTVVESAVEPPKMQYKEINPYFGNDEYVENSFLKKIISLKLNTRKFAENKNSVDIFYYFTLTEGGPFALKQRIYYEIVIRNGEEILAHHKNYVVVLDVSKKGLLVDVDKIWDDFILYAENIDDALARDLGNVN